MLAVAAMAVQNAMVELALVDTPSTAVMTTNTTQLCIDLVAISQVRGGCHRHSQSPPASPLGVYLFGSIRRWLHGRRTVILATAAIPLGDRLAIESRYQMK